MTKQTAFAAEDALTAAVAAPAQQQPGRRFTSFPPTQRSRVCRKAARTAGSWLDAAMATSPRRADHNDWMETHPSALAEFESMLAAASGKQIVMFLDYDGTLSPIVKDPDNAVMTEEMREAVRGVAEHFPTAIVSGRCRDKVLNFVKLAELYYAGSHGMDIKGPTVQCKHTKENAEAVLWQPASDFLPVIEEAYRALTSRMESIPGATVENNKFCLSVHFRCVQQEKWVALDDQVRSILKDYPGLRLTKGRKVLEVRPSIKWNKGNALEFLLKSLGFADSSDVFPIYIGDDRTDEDAFKVLRDIGQGVGILVTKVPKETSASYSLRDPSEVKEFLHKLVKSARTR